MQRGKRRQGGLGQLAKTLGLAAPAEQRQGGVQAVDPGAIGHLIAAQLAVIDLFPLQPIGPFARLQQPNPLAHFVETFGQRLVVGLLQAQLQGEKRLIGQRGAQQRALVPEALKLGFEVGGGGPDGHASFCRMGQG